MIKTRVCVFFIIIKHAPLHGVILHATVYISDLLHCRKCSAEDDQWIPFTVVIVSCFWCTVSKVFTVGKSLLILWTTKMILSAWRLTHVYVPASSHTLWIRSWVFPFVYAVSDTGLVGVLQFDLRYRRGRLLPLEFWSGGGKPLSYRGPSPSLWRLGLPLFLTFACLALLERIPLLFVPLYTLSIPLAIVVPCYLPTLSSNSFHSVEY